MSTSIPAAQRPFFRPDEADLVEDFAANGYVIRPAEDRAALDRIQEFVAKTAAGLLKVDAPNDPKAFLDTIHERVGVDVLNDFRLGVFRAMQAEDWFRPAYFSVARGAVEAIVGNELCMQRRVNLSIQMPRDDSSLLPVHADVWSGDSPYEAVLWMPMVDCHTTKSMYIANPDFDAKVQANFKDFEGKTAEDLYQDIKDHVTFLDIPYGHYLLFTQNLMHGNRINQEEGTRWSMNCRFKSVMSPYSDKRLGEFFEPITLRPATRLGLDYRLPGGFEE
jgi:sporadic carbohydrate cluster 2OG-Fe(II) oxygenase